MSDLFGHDVKQITLERQIQAAERELAQRLHVYPRRVGAGKMTQRKADEELACQRAIIESLHELKRLRGAPSLLGETP